MAVYTNTSGVPEDTDWVRQAFFVPKRGKKRAPNTRDTIMSRTGTMSIHALNFSDTSLGGNQSINPRPQFTRNADIDLDTVLARRVDDMNPSKTACMGMGAYYAEVIDANASRIIMQFGIPAFNSLGNFYTTFYDPMQGNMANSGKVAEGLIWSFSKNVASIIPWVIAPELCLVSLLYGTTKKAIADLQRRPLSKFYYMKPAMALYWSTVTVIVNALAVNMKLAQNSDPTALTKGENGIQIDYAKMGMSAAQAAELNHILPDVFLDGQGGIDIRAVANRWQRLNIAHKTKLAELQKNSATYEELEASLRNYIDSGGAGVQVPSPKSMGDFLKDYSQSVSGKGTYLDDELGKEGDSSKWAPDTSTSTAQDASLYETLASDFTVGVAAAQEGAKKIWLGLKKHMLEYHDFAKAEWSNGSEFVSFIVDWDAKVSESVSNRTGPSDIATAMNEKSRSNRARLFNFANGNIGDNMVAGALETVVSGVGAVLSSAADSVGFSGLYALGGKAFVDIPDFWQETSTRFGEASYTIQLRTPYGNKLSVLTQLMVPTAMLIAPTFPRSAGRAAYTGPMLCKLWQKGRVQISLGIISELTISRGTGNVGWSVDQLPLGIDISFTVTNLSKILHVPITTDTAAEDIFSYISQFDEDTNFTDYMAVLGSLSMSEQYEHLDRWALRRRRSAQNVKTFLSVNNFISTVVGRETIPGSLLALVYSDTERGK